MKQIINNIWIIIKLKSYRQISTLDPAKKRLGEPEDTYYEVTYKEIESMKEELKDIKSRWEWPILIWSELQLEQREIIIKKQYLKR